MPTIGELYNPLIKAAELNDNNGFELLNELGRMIFENNKDKCPNIEDGILAAKRNLGYYCQYFDKETELKVKQFYNIY